MSFERRLNEAIFILMNDRWLIISGCHDPAESGWITSVIKKLT